MKKLLCTLLAGLTLLCCAAVVFAEEEEVPITEYAISDMNMLITLPDDYEVLTRDFEDDDPFLSRNNIDPDTLRSNFEQGNIYLNALKSEGQVSQEIVVTYAALEEVKNTKNLRSLSELELSIAEKVFDSPQTINGTTLTYSSHTRETIDNVLFFKLKGTMAAGGASAHLLQYYTVLDGKAVNINYYSYSGAVDAASEAEFDSIVKTVRFTDAAAIAAAQVPESKGQTPGLVIGLVVAGVAIIAGIIVLAVVLTGRSKKKYQRVAEDPFDYKPPYEDQ